MLALRLCFSVSEKSSKKQTKNEKKNKKHIIQLEFLILYKKSTPKNKKQQKSPKIETKPQLYSKN